MISSKMTLIKFSIVLFLSNDSLASSEVPETLKIFLFFKNFFSLKILGFL